jgi:hypothetical protein
MTSVSLIREFTFSEEDTCKRTWIFKLLESADGLVVDDLEIVEDPEPEGCKGHPKTIAALVRGRPVNSIDTEVLAEAACGRDVACGQLLAKCIQEIIAA